ncbi:MAG TPA: DUF1080 domain-containing protein [Verrucomicrobiales bacterium]|nr:DUF1080 domain-containing protein [Verrucomicrobiales bacterium]
MRTTMLFLRLSAACAIGAVAGTAGAEEGWESLFDGETLKDWDGNPKFWSVQDGAITGETTKENPTEGNTFLVWTGGEAGDFELKLQYRFLRGDADAPAGNSGIQYRSFRLDGAPDAWRIGGYQADMEAGDTWSGILYGENFRGILAKRGEKTEIGEDGAPKVVEQFGESAEIQGKIHKEDWNEYHITAEGFHFVHRINGTVTAECTDNDTDMRRASGLLALQLHAGPPMKVQFREIQLKRAGSVEEEVQATAEDSVAEEAATEEAATEEAATEAVATEEVAAEEVAAEEAAAEEVSAEEAAAEEAPAEEAPAEEAPAEEAPAEGLVIELRGDGMLRVKGVELALDKAGEVLAAHAGEAGKGVILRATAETPMEQVRGVVEACHAAGRFKVTLRLVK